VNCLQLYGNDFYAATKQGIYVSSNNGDFWQDIGGDLFLNKSINIIDIAAKDTIVFALTEEGEVYFKTKNVNIWHIIKRPENRGDAEKICTLFSDGKDVFAGMDSGGAIYILTTNLSAWLLKAELYSDGTLYNRTSRYVRINNLFKFNNKLFAATNNGVMFSENDGNTWKTFTIRDPKLEVMEIITSSNYAVSTVINEEKLETFLTANLGKTWEKIENLPCRCREVEEANWGCSYCPNKITKLFSNCFATSNSMLFIGGRNSIEERTEYPLFKSANNGKTWAGLNLPSGIEMLDIFYKKPYLIVATTEGIFRSADTGKQWELAMKGINNELIFNLQKVKDNLVCEVNHVVYVYNKNEWVTLFNGVQINSYSGNDKYLFGVTATKILRADNNGGFNFDTLAFKGLPPLEHDTAYVEGSDTIHTTTGAVINFIKATEDSVYLGIRDENYRATVFISIDNGKTFFPENGPKPMRDLSLKKVPSNQKISIADLVTFNVRSIVSSDSNLFAATNKGIYYSNNKGNSWLLSRFSDTIINAFISHNSVFYAGTENAGVYLSKDRGITWQHSGFSKAVKSFVTTKKAVFASIFFGGLFVTRNNGLNWDSLQINPESDITLESREDVLYLRSGSGDNSKQFISSDEGVTWINLRGLPKQNISSITYDKNTIYAVSNNSLFSTKNDGISWEESKTNFQLKENNLNNLYAVAANDKMLCVSTDAALFTSYDKGKTWSSHVTGKYVDSLYSYKYKYGGPLKKLSLFNSIIYALFPDSGYSDKFSGVSFSADSGKTWQRKENKNFPAIVGTFMADNNNIYIWAGGCMYNSCSGDLFASSDSGMTWHIVPETDKNKRYLLENLRATCFIDDGTFYYAGTADEGVFRSKDGGKSWLEKSEGLKIKKIKKIIKAGNNLLAFGEISYHTSLVFISENYGDSWEIIKPQKPDSGQLLYSGSMENYYFNFNVSQIAAINSTVLISTWQGFYISFNGGLTWDSLKIKIQDSREVKFNFSDKLVSNDQYFFTVMYQEEEQTGEPKVIPMGYSLAPRAGGLYRSTDGKYWRKVDLGISDLAITGLAAKNSTIFALTPSGIFCSDTNGDSWKLLPQNNEMGYVGFISYAGDTLFAGASEGVFFSEDKGNTWRKLNSFSCWNTGNVAQLKNNMFVQDASNNVFYSANPGTSWKLVKEEQIRATVKIFNADKNKIYFTDNKSTKFSINNGKTWETVSINKSYALPNDNCGTNVEIPVFKAVGKALYIGSRHFGVLESKDGAMTFSKVENGLPSFTDNSWNRTAGIFACENYIFICLASPEAYVGTYVSVDKGKTWQLLNNGMPVNANISAIVNHNKKYFAATSKGLFVTNDKGKQWLQIKCTGLPDNVMKELSSDGENLFLAVQSSNPAFANGYMSNLNEKIDDKVFYRSEDEGKTWMRVNGLQDKFLIRSAVSGKNLLVNVYQKDNSSAEKVDTFNVDYGNGVLKKMWQRKLVGKLYISSNQGKTWEVPEKGLPKDVSINKFLVTEKYIFLTSDSGLFRSADHGKSWVTINKGLEENYSTGPNGKFYQIYHLERTGKRLWTISYQIYYSDDNGDSWIKATPENQKTLENVNVHSSIGKNVFAFWNGQLQMSHNFGKDWKEISNGLDVQYITAFEANKKSIFLGTNNGVYRSDDKGRSWNKKNNGITSPYKFILSLSLQGKSVYAVCNGDSFESADNGNNWKRLHTPGNNQSNLPKDIIASTSSFSIAKDNNSGKTYYSINGKKSWRVIDSIFSYKAVNLTVKDNNAIYSSTSNGLFVLRDKNATWSLLKADRIETFAIHNNLIAYSKYRPNSNPYQSIIVISKDGGKSWVETVPNVEVTGLQILDKTLYIATAGRSVLKKIID
jgi:photosystem II stability/assembly factor-like uncharacterized protein